MKTEIIIHKDKKVIKKTKSDGTTPLVGVQFTIRKKGTETPVLQTVISATRNYQQ